MIIKACCMFLIYEKFPNFQIKVPIVEFLDKISTSLQP